MNKIGMRNLKTTIAILVCLEVDVLFTLINPVYDEFLYSPFFAGIAAAYSLQSNQQNSVRQARIRSIGSIIGGILGIAALYFYDFALKPIFLLSLGPSADMFIYYLVVALVVIPLIYYLANHQQSQLIFVAILTYLSVTVGTRNNLPAYIFGANRILSTIFGVLIALLLNKISFHFHKNKDILFVTALDGALLSNERQLSNYARYQLGQMLKDGINLTISTTRTPASLVKILDGLEFPSPLMIMNGAAVFDMKSHHYSHIKFFDSRTRQGIESLLEAHHRNAFVTSIIDDVLTIYHGEFANEAEQLFFERRRNDSFRSHIKGDLKDTQHTVFYILIDHENVVRDLENEIKHSSFSNEVLTSVYPFIEIPGYFYLKINSAIASKLLALHEFVHVHKPKMVVTVGSKSFDIPMMEVSDYSFVSIRADFDVRSNADFVLSDSHPDAVVRELARIFYHPNPTYYLSERSRKKDLKSNQNITQSP